MSIAIQSDPMNAFEVMLYNLEKMGFFGFLLPWIFTFVVLYAVLVKTKVLGDDHRLIGVLSIVVAFFTITFGGPALASFFTNFFGMLAIIIAGVLGIVMLLALTGADISKTLNVKSVHMILAGILIVTFVIALASYGVKIGNNIVGIVFILALMGAVMMFVTKNG